MPEAAGKDNQGGEAMNRWKRILKAVAKAAAIMAAGIAIGFAVTFVLAAADHLLGPWGALGAVALAGIIIIAIFEYQM